MNNNIITELNQLLSDFHLYYQNTRAAHWNIKGKHFFELHAKFEELYSDALSNIDEIAERILTIGGTPIHTLERYLSQSKIDSSEDITEDRRLVEITFSNLTSLINQENIVKNVATQNGDSVTEDMMIQLINNQDKMKWMLKAWLNK